jgi:hypothetical protein
MAVLMVHYLVDLMVIVMVEMMVVVLAAMLVVLVDLKVELLELMWANINLKNKKQLLLIYNLNQLINK